MPQPDGAPLRAHLQSAARAGQVDPLLVAAAEPLPSAVAGLWGVFEQLCGTRAVDGALTFTEIESWQRLMGVRLSAWEVETIRAMDQAATAAGEAARKRRGTGS